MARQARRGEVQVNKKFLEYRKRFHELPILEEVSDFPIHLDIELTNRCNLKCEMCPFHGKDKIDTREHEDMNFELYKKIIDEGSKKGLKSVKLNFGGEPLLYEKLPEAIHYAKKRGVLDVHINTNGLLIDNKTAIMLIQSHLDLLILTDYDISTQKVNLVRLLTIRDAWGKTHPKVRVKSNDTKKWYKIADEIVPNVYFDYCNLKEKFEKVDFKCAQPWQRFLVLSNGLICSCSCGFVIDEKIIQNAQFVSIETAWKSKKMKFLRHCHSTKESHLIRECRYCPGRKDLNIKKVSNTQDERLFTESISKRL